MLAVSLIRDSQHLLESNQTNISDLVTIIRHEASIATRLNLFEDIEGLSGVSLRVVESKL